ncbi:conserved hypothetical protein [Leishmania major strain Friedlin]|uniref:Uncharacterized protein n=1 Tax=Leishmania major TaxID=5664 RepID=Q4QHZ8_LEIMA|nr:conserved hypothetical protein [Leishmania major strain Friedlin]CAG9569630.1 hypothetical_protein_-__conserved [Leishmania major strain Friedlin]CAJ02417.1 conserved hypothetical protein [Leishmania major strain Friedlin]|eukprot:XP_001681200.1 conserved hypothetical protein [Leishmania major strain Friedlin]
MLNLLLELLVSIALCVALAYFAFLNVPVEAEEPGSPAAASAGDGASAMVGAAPSGALPRTGSDGAEYGHVYDPLLLLPHELPLYTSITRYVSLAEDTTLGIAYRWLLINGLHYSPREVYGERRLREWGYYYSSSVGGSSGGKDIVGALSGAGMRVSDRSSSAVASSLSSAGSTMAASLDSSRCSRRRLRRGAAAAAAALPTPLRRESAHWVNVLIRCAAFLCLGGGTVKPEVWTDHLLYSAEKVLESVNAGYENRMRARAAQAHAVAAQLASAAHSSPPPDRASSQSAAPLLTASRKPLLRIQLLELGSGLLGSALRDVHRPPLSLHHGAGDASGSTATPSRAAPPARRAATAAVAGSPGMAPSATSFAYHHHHSNSSVSSDYRQQVSSHAALCAPSFLLSSSVAGLSTAITDAVSSMTTCGADSAHLSDPVAGAPVADYAGSCSLFTGGCGGASSAGAQLGVVLPRVEGDVISVEQAHSEGCHMRPPTPAASNSTPARAPSGAVSASPLPQASAAFQLRCFAVPLLYEDQRFHVRLGCCLPLGALLPVSLCVPPDVLTLNCAVAVHRVTFAGHLYAAFHGARVELSFPTAPLFTAVVKVMPDTSDASSGSGSVAKVSRHGGWGMRTAGGSGAHSGAAAAATAFTATYTQRNEATAVGGSIARGRDSYKAAARPPLPPRSGLYSSSSNASLHHHHRSGMSGGGGASTSGSCLNEHNEKVQEVVLLAVRRLIDSLTYPKVLVGELVCRRPSGAGGTAEGGAEMQLQLRWTRQTASLPLCM